MHYDYKLFDVLQHHDIFMLFGNNIDDWTIFLWFEIISDKTPFFMSYYKGSR